MLSITMAAYSCVMLHHLGAQQPCCLKASAKIVAHGRVEPSARYPFALLVVRIIIKVLFHAEIGEELKINFLISLFSLSIFDVLWFSTVCT